MPRRADTPGSPPHARRAAGGMPAGWRWWAGVVASLVGVSLLGPALPGCSSKPARKQGKGKAAAARARAEKALVETAPEPAGAEESPPPADVAMAAGRAPEDAPEATAVASAPADGAAVTAPAPVTSETAPAESVATEQPAAAEVPAMPTLGDDGEQRTRRDEKRPSSPLIDPDTAIALDGGRVEVSSPKGWARSPRSQSYLVRYQPTPRKSIPSIVVTAEPAPAGLETVTRTNEADLVAAITKKLAIDFPAGGTVKVIKKPAAVALGPHAGVAWAVPGSAKIDGLTETIDRFAWGVVLGGRLYVVEARGPRAKLDDAVKDLAKAVASTLFRPGDAPEGNPDATPAAAGPAEGE